MEHVSSKSVSSKSVSSKSVSSKSVSSKSVSYHHLTSRGKGVRSWCDGSSDRSFMGWAH